MASFSVTMVDILGGHALDLFTYILGPISSLTAVAKNQVRACTIIDLDGNPTGEVMPQSKPTQYCVTGVLESGAPFCVHFQTGVPETEFNWVIHGEKGTLRIVDMDTTNPAKHGLVDATPQVHLNGKKIELPVEENRSGLLWEAVAEGKESYATLEDAVRIREVLAAILQSEKEGRRVDL